MTNIAGASILVVEDERAFIDLIIAAIEGAGCVVVGPATDVPQALALLETTSVSAAIVDLILHGVYADAIAIELARRKIPFAVTTGIGASLAHPELRGAMTITKPFQASHIQIALEELIAADSQCGDATPPR